MSNTNKTINTVSGITGLAGLVVSALGLFLGDNKLKKAGITMLTVGATGLIANNVFNGEDSEQRTS